MKEGEPEKKGKRGEGGKEIEAGGGHWSAAKALRGPPRPSGIHLPPREENKEKDGEGEKEKLKEGNVAVRSLESRLEALVALQWPPLYLFLSLLPSFSISLSLYSPLSKEGGALDALTASTSHC